MADNGYVNDILQRLKENMRLFEDSQNGDGEEEKGEVSDNSDTVSDEGKSMSEEELRDDVAVTDKSEEEFDENEEENENSEEENAEEDLDTEGREETAKDSSSVSEDDSSDGEPYADDGENHDEYDNIDDIITALGSLEEKEVPEEEESEEIETAEAENKSEKSELVTFDDSFEKEIDIKDVTFDDEESADIDEVEEIIKETPKTVERPSFVPKPQPISEKVAAYAREILGNSIKKESFGENFNELKDTPIETRPKDIERGDEVSPVEQRYKMPLRERQSAVFTPKIPDNLLDNTVIKNKTSETVSGDAYAKKESFYDILINTNQKENEESSKRTSFDFKTKYTSEMDAANNDITVTNEISDDVFDGGEADDAFDIVMSENCARPVIRPVSEATQTEDVANNGSNEENDNDPIVCAIDNSDVPANEPEIITDASKIKISDIEDLKAEMRTIKEYTSNSQNSDINRKFALSKAAYIIRLSFVALISLLLFAIENSEFFSFDILAVFGIKMRYLALIDLALVIITALICIKDFISLFDSIGHGKAGVRMMLLPFFAAIVTSDIMIAVKASDYTAMYGLSFAFAVLANILSGMMKNERDMLAFSVVSSSGDKLVCDLTSSDASETESTGSDKIVRICKSGFVSGFVKNSKADVKPTVKGLIVPFLTTALSVGAAVLSSYYFKDIGVVPVASSFALSVSLTSFVFFLLIRSFLTMSIVRRASEAGSAVIGDRAIDEFAASKAMIFEDVEAFPSSLAGVVKIKLVSDCTLNDVLYYISSLFRHVGGPLESVFGVASSELGITDDVKLISSENGGLFANISDTPVCVGSSEFLEKLGVEVPFDDEDARRIQTGPISIMYVSVNGKYLGKFYIRYAFDRNFARRVVELRRAGIRTAIRTFDPNITDELVLKTTKLSSYGLRIVHKNASQVMDFGKSKSDSTVITKYTAAQLISTILLCKKTRKISRIFTALGIISVCASLCLFFILAKFALTSSIYSLYTFLYQLFFMLLAIIFAKVYL